MKKHEHTILGSERQVLVMCSTKVVVKWLLSVAVAAALVVASGLVAYRIARLHFDDYLQWCQMGLWREVNEILDVPVQGASVEEIASWFKPNATVLQMSRSDILGQVEHPELLLYTIGDGSVCDWTVFYVSHLELLYGFYGNLRIGSEGGCVKSVVVDLFSRRRSE